MQRRDWAFWTGIMWTTWRICCAPTAHGCTMGWKPKTSSCCNGIRDQASAQAKLADLEALGDGVQYVVDLTLRRENPSQAEYFGDSSPVQLRS